MNEQLPTVIITKDTSTLLKDTYLAVMEAATGVAGSAHPEWFQSAGRILQQLRNGKMIAQLSAEWDGYRAKGKIKDDYQQTEQHQSCLQELLDSLDKDGPDTLRFEAMKKILLVAASENGSDRDSFLPQQFMQVVRTLKSGEIVLLSTVYWFAKDKKWKEQAAQFGDVQNWRAAVADKSSLKHKELVKVHEEELDKKGLIYSPIHVDRSGVLLGDNFRLTSFGFELCEYMSKYEPLVEGNK